MFWIFGNVNGRYETRKITVIFAVAVLQPADLHFQVY